MQQAMEVLELARERLNPELELLDVVLNIVDMASDHARNSVQTLLDRFGPRLFRTVLHVEALPTSKREETEVPTTRGEI